MRSLDDIRSPSSRKTPLLKLQRNPLRLDHNQPRTLNQIRGTTADAIINAIESG